MNKRAYQNCCVFGCLNTTLNKSELTFFRLPTSAERRIEWLKLINREDLHDKPSTHCRVCEDHFDVDSILTSPNRKVLKQNSIPTLLKSNKKNETRGSQAIVETAESSTQCDLFQADVILQTRNYLSSDTSRKRKLNNDLHECKKRLKTTTAEPESNMFFRLCDKFLSKNLADTVKEQTKLKFNYPGNRYSVKYKLFCLNLFYVSPQAYNLLKDTLCLPSKSSLKSMYVPITTKVNNYLMQVLKIKAEQMTYMEKNCTLVMDAMSLKTNLLYNIREDKIYGFHEIDGIQTPEPAKYALVAMIHGIFVKYSQPVGYALLAERKNYESVTEWIDKLIQKLYEIGLNVRVFVSDTGSDFLSTAKKRFVSAERPYFYVDNRKIFYVFDPPHLIKLVRNNLITYDFHFDNFVAKWDYILQFYEKEKTKQLRIATKLTKSHIEPSTFEKMQVKFAVQVLSATVAAGISMYRDFGVIDPSAEGTIKLITMMNDLFDFLNSSSRYGCSKYQNAFCGEEYQTAFINDMIQFFASLKLIDRKNGKDVTTTIQFIEGFRITLKSILLLFEDLRIEGDTHILTRKLNQDCLENFFGQVRARNGSSTEPTSWQLVSAFRNFFFIDFIEPPKEGKCSDDLSKMFLKDQKLHTKSASQIKQEEEKTLTVASYKEHEEKIQRTNMQLITTTDYINTFDLSEKNTIQIKQEQENTLTVASEREHEENMQLSTTTDYNTLCLPEKNAFSKIKQEQENTLTVASDREHENMQLSTITHFNTLSLPEKNTSSQIKQEQEHTLTVESDREHGENMKLSTTTDYNTLGLPEKNASSQIKQEQENTLTVASQREYEENMQCPNMQLITTTDYNTIDLPEKNAIVYISGYLLNKCSAQHKDCDLFKSYLNSVGAAQNFAHDTRYIRYKEYYKDGGKTLLFIPQDDFIKFVESMEEQFVLFFKKNKIKCRIIKGLLAKVENLSFSMPCTCFPVTYSKELYLRMRLYYTLKYNNRGFRTCRTQRKYFSVDTYR